LIWLCISLDACKQSGGKWDELVSTLPRNNVQIKSAELIESYDLSDKIESIEVIPLIEQKGHYLGDIYKVFYHNGQFVVHDRVNAPQILLFDSEGQFKKQILGIGKAPHEALQIDDCWANNDGTFDAYDFAQKKVYHYNSAFDLVDTQKGETNLYHNLFRIPGSRDFLAYSTLNAYNTTLDSRNYQLEVLDDELKAKKGFLQYFEDIKGANILAFNSQFHVYGDTVRFIRPYDNNVYNIVNGEFKSVTEMKFSENALDWDKFQGIVKSNEFVFKDRKVHPREKNKLLSNFSYCYGDWVEDDDHVVLSSMKNGKGFQTIIDKNNSRNQINARYFTETKKYNMILPVLTSSGDGYLIGFINSLMLSKHLLGESSLKKYVDPKFNSFLLVKLKLASKNA